MRASSSAIAASTSCVMISTSCSTSFLSGFMISHSYIGGRVAVPLLQGISRPPRFQVNLKFTLAVGLDTGSPVLHQTHDLLGKSGASVALLDQRTRFLFQILLFHQFYLIHARLVTSAAEFGCQPGLDDLLRQINADQSSAQRQHVRIVMLAAIDRGRIII